MPNWLTPKVSMTCVTHSIPMRAYIKKLLENPNVMRHLSAYHGEILTQFEVLAAADAL